MTTQAKNLMMINTKMNIRMHRMHNQGRIDYVVNNVNTEYDRVIKKYYGGL